MSDHMTLHHLMSVLTSPHLMQWPHPPPPLATAQLHQIVIHNYIYTHTHKYNIMYVCWMTMIIIIHQLSLKGISWLHNG